MKILVVEDKGLLRWSLQQALTRLGYDVTIERSGEEALARVSETSFDWVITDFRLPGISGLDILHAAKRASSGTQVIVISAHGSPELREEVLRSGANYFLAKPFDLNELVRLIRGASEEPADVRSSTQELGANAT